jgi:hypothetical protein
VRFFSATFGAGVVAAQRPITCPKRQLQPERYATGRLKLFENWIQQEYKIKLILDYF